MVKLASQTLLFSWSSALDIVRSWDCSSTKQIAQRHVCHFNHNRSCQCTYDSKYNVTLINTCTAKI